MQPLNGFNQLPADVRNMMFTRHFTPRMIGNLIRSHKLAIPEALWQKFFLEENGGYIPSTVTSWKEAYAKMALLKRNIHLNNFKAIEPGKSGINWFRDYWISTKEQNLIFHGPDGKEIVRRCPQKNIWNNYFKPLDLDHFCTSNAWMFNEITIESEDQSFTIWENLRPKMTVTTPGRYTFIEDHYVRIEDRQNDSENHDLFITNYKTIAAYPPVTIKERKPILQIKDKVLVVVSSRFGMETWNIETPTKLSSTYFPSDFKWNFSMNPHPLLITICQEHVVNTDENLCIRAFPIMDLSNSFIIPRLTHCVFEKNRFFGFTQNTQSFVEFDLKTKQTIRTFHLQQQNQSVGCLCVGGNRIWAATASGNCHIFNTDKGDEVAITNCSGYPEMGSLIFQPPFVYLLKLDRVEFYLFGSGSHLGTLRLAKLNLHTSLFIQYDFVVNQEYNPKFYNLYQYLSPSLLKKVKNFFTPKKKEVKKP